MPELEELLENPIWNALTTAQSGLALGGVTARRFPAAIGPLSGLALPTTAAFEELRALTAPEGAVALFLEASIEVPEKWALLRDALMQQMIWPEGHTSDVPRLAAGAEMRQLTESDGDEMMALAHLTAPGPFGRRTRELGEFFGIFERGRLMAMTGQRLQIGKFSEVSAVCTHPDARGRGYARVLVARVTDAILARGRWPMLHVLDANHGAIRVYEQVGYRMRRRLHLLAMRRMG